MGEVGRRVGTVPGALQAGQVGRASWGLGEASLYDGHSQGY